MAQIKQKLKSRRGASILIAMILLLVATMVSIVIVNASLTATHRAKSSREYTQKMLYLQSAAELFKAELGKTTCTIKQVVTQYEKEEPDKGEVLYDCSTNALGAMIMEAVRDVEEMTGEVTKIGTKSLKISAGDPVPDVTVEFTMFRNRAEDETFINFDNATGSDAAQHYLYKITGTLSMDGVKMYFNANTNGLCNIQSAIIEKEVPGEGGAPPTFLRGTKTTKTLTMNGWDAQLYTFGEGDDVS